MDACGPLMLEDGLTSKEEHKTNIDFIIFLKYENIFASVFDSSQRIPLTWPLVPYMQYTSVH